MKKLSNIAHSRAGDKGNTLILSLFPFDELDYPLLVEKITAERVQQHLADQVKGPVI
ncbi:MAG: AtuA-related protein, partial [Algoriphagus sp.]